VGPPPGLALGGRPMPKRFSDRIDAGKQLAAKLHQLCGADTVVVALPRGGVPVAFPVARALRAPLDILAVRKLGVPFQPEVAMGAIGEGGVRVVDEAIAGAAGVSPADFAAVEATERVELDRQIRRFRDDRPPISLAGRTVVIVDDGIATGSTARAACLVARAHGAARVVLRRFRTWSPSPTISSISPRSPPPTASGSGTWTSHRRPTTRWSPSWLVPGPPARRTPGCWPTPQLPTTRRTETTRSLSTPERFVWRVTSPYLNRR
jgi:predicted phosphoribosyltransferase